MWIWMTLGSALLLGLYDVAKKKALGRNDVLWVLLGSTFISTLLLSPFMVLRHGDMTDHLMLMGKAVLVSLSWISGLFGIKWLPLTTASTMKATRPAFVVLFSVLAFGERLGVLQWTGVLLVLVSMYMLTTSSRKDVADRSNRNKGLTAMALSIVAGVASALFDKYIMRSMDPLFVQSWCNLYISVILGVAVAAEAAVRRDGSSHLHFDPMLIVVAVLITAADCLYFASLAQDGALLSVISLLRRLSVVVTFAAGALIFKEKRLKEKGLWLAMVLAGMVCLVAGS